MKEVHDPFPEIELAAAPALQLLLQNYRNAHCLIWNELRDLSPEQFEWQPAKGIPSIRTIVDRLLTSIRVWVAELRGQSIEIGTLLLPGECRPPTRSADAYLADLVALYLDAGIYFAGKAGDPLSAEIRTWYGYRIAMGVLLQDLIRTIDLSRGQIAYIKLLPGFPPSGTRLMNRPRTITTHFQSRRGIEADDHWK